MKNEQNNRVLRELTHIFRKYKSISKASLFGSRARRDATETSDFDIAIYGEIPPKERAELRLACSEELQTLHKIDLVFMNITDDENFMESVKREEIVFYDKTR